MSNNEFRKDAKEYFMKFMKKTNVHLAIGIVVLSALLYLLLMVAFKSCEPIISAKLKANCQGKIYMIQNGKGVNDKLDHIKFLKDKKMSIKDVKDCSTCQGCHTF